MIYGINVYWYFSDLHTDTTILLPEFLYAFSYGRQIGNIRPLARSYIYMLGSAVIFSFSLLLYSFIIEYKDFNLDISGIKNIDFVIIWSIPLFIVCNVRYILERIGFIKN